MNKPLARLACIANVRSNLAEGHRLLTRHDIKTFQGPLVVNDNTVGVAIQCPGTA